MFFVTIQPLLLKIFNIFFFFKSISILKNILWKRVQEGVKITHFVAICVVYPVAICVVYTVAIGVVYTVAIYVYTVAICVVYTVAIYLL